MPIYAYECNRCSSIFTALLWASEVDAEVTPACKRCGDEDATKIPSAPAKPRFFGMPRGWKKMSKNVPVEEL